MRTIKIALACGETDLTIRRDGHPYALGCLAFVFLSLNACSSQVGETSETAGGNEPIATQSAALYDMAEYTDPSGTIHVRHTGCDWVGEAQHNFASCGIGGAHDRYGQRYKQCA